MGLWARNPPAPSGDLPRLARRSQLGDQRFPQEVTELGDQRLDANDSAHPLAAQTKRLRYGPAPAGGRRRPAGAAPGTPGGEAQRRPGRPLAPSLSLLPEPSPPACPPPRGNPASPIQAAERWRFGQSRPERAPPRAKGEQRAFPKHPPPPQAPRPVSKGCGACAA